LDTEFWTQGGIKLLIEKGTESKIPAFVVYEGLPRVEKDPHEE